MTFKKEKAQRGISDFIAKHKRLTVSIMLVFALLISASIMTRPTTFKANAASLITAEAAANIKAKQDFAAKHKQNRVQLTQEELATREEKFDQLLRDNTLTQEEKEVELNAIGYYTFENGVEVKDDSSLRSSASNVNLNRVSVTYNSNTDNWELSANGSWLSTNYWDKSDVSAPKEGKKYNVGSADTLGIILNNISGDSTGMYLKDGSSYITWSSYKETNYNRSALISSSTNGAVYNLTDYNVITKVGFLALSYDWAYVGDIFGTRLTYSSEFANISGNAVFMYAHTWEETSINSISIGKDGIGFGWTTTGGSFDIISGDKPF